MDATELGLMTDSAILQRSLSLKSIISTTSSFSRRFQSARFRPDLQEINQVGLGLQGAVFETVGKPLVLKKESPGNEALFSNLRHEYAIHCDVSAAFERYQTATNNEVHVPKPFEFISKTHNHVFWMKSYRKCHRLTARAGTPSRWNGFFPCRKSYEKH
jgi:hypothetical protein